MLALTPALEASGPSGSRVDGVGIVVSSRHRSELVVVPGIYGWRQQPVNEREHDFGGPGATELEFFGAQRMGCRALRG